MIRACRKFSKLAVLLLVVLVWTGTASAQSPVVAVGSASGAAGTAVNLPVNFTAGATGVSSLQFDLTLPSGVTSPSPPSVTTASAASAAGKSASASILPSGAVRVLIFGLNQNTIGSGGLAAITLNIASGTAAGTLTVGISGIVASDAGGNAVTTSGTNGSVVVTVPVDTTPPTISGVGSSGVTYNAAAISWTTNEASDTQVEYGKTTTYGSSTVLNAALVTSHSAALSGLTASTTYHYRVKSKDAVGNLATSGDFTFATSAASDTTAPTISGVGSSGISQNAATVSWTTNEASDTQVEYGRKTLYGSFTTLNTIMVTSHSQVLSGLRARTTYHYRVRSKDAAGNQAVSGDFTFTTASSRLAATSKTNLLFRDYSTGQNMVWLLDGTSNLGSLSLGVVSDSNWKIVGTADFNGDDKVDILWRHDITGQNLVWFMDGTTYIGYNYLTTVTDTNWKIVGTGDFNGDDKVDILWHHDITGQNLVWLMDGTTYSGRRNLTPVTDVKWRIVGVYGGQ